MDKVSVWFYPKRNGAIWCGIKTPPSKPKLAVDGGSWLIFERHFPAGEVTLDGMKLGVRGFVKLWANVPQKDRREAVMRRMERDIVLASPLLT